MQEIMVKLFGNMDGENIIFNLFSITLLFILMGCLKINTVSRVFADKRTGEPSYTKVLAAYLVVLYSTLSGYLALDHVATVDLPFNVVLLVSALIGIKRAGDVMTAKNGDAK